MSTAGPELPPHLLAKRKRQELESHAPLPSPPSRSRSSSVSSNSAKRCRILGPSLPSAPLSELPRTAPNPARLSDESDSDDDFGPSLPTDQPSAAETQRQQTILEEEEAALAAAQKPKRDEWMLVPPTSDDWSSRIDPTKLRNRKFNTGKGSKAPPPKGGEGDGNALWTETPEQKRKRLEDEVMGVKRPAQLGGEEKQHEWREKESQETARRIREYNVCPSLLVLFPPKSLSPDGRKISFWNFADIRNPPLFVAAGEKPKYVAVQRTQKGRAQGEGRRSEQTGFRQGEGHGRRDQNRACSEERTLEPSGGFWLEIRRGKLSLVD